MQALSIYLIIRLDEGESQDNMLDSILIAAIVVGRIVPLNFFLIRVLIVQALASEFNALVVEAPGNDDLAARWDHWLFEESKRRFDLLFIFSLSKHGSVIDDRILGCAWYIRSWIFSSTSSQRECAMHGNRRV